jgi:ferredoxin
MRLTLDTERCTGHGRCYVLSGELFEDDEYGHGMVRGDGTFDPSRLAAAQRAVWACPEQAIALVDGPA